MLLRVVLIARQGFKINIRFRSITSVSFCHLLQGGSQKTNLVTSVSKIIVPYKFPCRCHNCQSELRINLYDIFLSASKFLSSRPFLSKFQSISPFIAEFWFPKFGLSGCWKAATQTAHVARPFAPGFNWLLIEGWVVRGEWKEKQKLPLNFKL